MTDTALNDVVPTAARRRRLVWLAAVVLVVVGVSVGLVIAAGRGGNSSTQVASAAPVASVNGACTSWMASAPATPASSSSWCADMTSWMNQQVSTGRMTAATMWGDPERMLASCRLWVTTSPSGTPPATACDDMVTWMRQHANGDWNGSMMNGSMMGG